MTFAVALEDVSKSYGAVTALEDVTLRLAPGETVAFVGHNGAGKTTMMKLILGLIRPSRGTVRILGEDPAGRAGARLRRRLGFLPESVAFHAAMTGRELLDFYARLKREPVEASDELLDEVGLGHAADRRVGTYSKGMRQRLALAQALIGEPSLLLLDEPTSGLDPESRAQVYATVDRFRAAGATILVSTHALAEIEPHVDRVALLHQGRLIADGDLASLRRQGALPARLRLRVHPCTVERVLRALPGTFEVVSRSQDRAELAVPPAAKLDLLRGLAAMPDVLLDVEIEDAGLEALYRHLTAGENA